MTFDYKFVQGLSNFGRQLAGKFVGQPFSVYRLNARSNGDVISPENLINDDLRAKVTPTGSHTLIENEELHSNIFEFMCSSDAVELNDVLVQHDDAYGGDAAYVVISRRPLKKVLCARAERLCRIERSTPNRQSGYNGPVFETADQFTLIDGKFVIRPSTDPGTIIPVGLQYIGQLKGNKPTRLPMDTQVNFWYVYVPLFPGMERLRENDMIMLPNNFDDPTIDEPIVRYRVDVPYASPAGTTGVFALCERVTP